MPGRLPDMDIHDKQMIANQIVGLINTINKLMVTKTVTTFDLKDMRELVKKQSDCWEIDNFKNIFEQIWKVWPE
jgi:hypothetical protein